MHLRQGSGSSGGAGIKEQATKWLHPLKRAIAFKSIDSFDFKGREAFPEEDMRKLLGQAKEIFLKMLSGRPNTQAS